jgi:hypothetical protein
LLKLAALASPRPDAPKHKEAISRAETHNAAKAEYDRLAALRIKLGPEIPSYAVFAHTVPRFM